MALNKLLNEIDPLVTSSGFVVSLVCGTRLQAEILGESIENVIAMQKINTRKDEL